MVKRKLICLVGMCGAGKSEVADYLLSKRKFGFLRFGQITLDVVKKMASSQAKRWRKKSARICAKNTEWRHLQF